MIRNNMKKIIERSGINQKELSKILGVAPAVMSGVCNGERILPYEKLAECADVFGISVSNIYQPDILAALYGVEEGAKKIAPEKVRVRIERDMVENLDALIERGIYKSRPDAVNAILRNAL